MGAAKAHGHPKALGTAHGNIRAQFTHRRQQHLGHRINGHGRDHPGQPRRGQQGRRIPQASPGSRQLQQHPKNVPSQGWGCSPRPRPRQRLGIDQLQFDPQRFSAGLEYGQGLGEDGLIHQKTQGLGPLADRPGQGHGLCRSGGLIEQGGIGNRQPGQLADQGLEIEQGLKPALGDFSLIRGVGRIPSGIFKDVTLDHRRGGRAVVTLANQAAHHLVVACDSCQFSQGLGLTAGLGQTHQGLPGGQQDVGRHNLGC